MYIIFDMDGLMFDTEKVFIMAWNYAGEKIGIGKAGYMVYKTLGMNIVSSYNVWREEFGDRYNQEEFRKYTKEFLQKYYSENTVPVKKGLYNLLNYLKENSCKMAVASSSPRWEVEKHLKACELLEANPSECYALEDSKNGLLSAYRAGCKPIMVPDLWQPDEEILNVIVGKYEDLDEVKAAFEKIHIEFSQNSN